MNLASKLDKMISILADVADKFQEPRNYPYEAADMSPNIHSSRMLTPRPSSRSAEGMLLISGGEIEESKSTDSYRALLDPRDQILTFPFTFQIYIGSEADRIKSRRENFFESETYRQLRRQIENYLVEMLETIVSVSFNLLV